MATFTYIAKDETGATVNGTIAAESQIEAARAIRREGKFVVRMAQGNSAAALAKSVSPSKDLGGVGKRERYKPDDLIYFTNQLAVMLDTGVSLAEALQTCVNDTNSPAFARALNAVIDEVIGGQQFSATLAKHPRIFPLVYVNLVKASEATGAMGPMLQRLADFLEHQRELSSKIKGAIAYPIFMMFFACGVTAFLVAFVLPRFGAIYAGREDKLPAITRYLMAFSEVLISYGLYALAVLVAGGVGAYFYMRTPAGALVFERMRFAVPLIGPLYHKTCLARSVRTLGTMIQSGVAILESVQLTAGVSGSRHYHAMWTGVQSKLETGQQLSDALAERTEIPRPVNKMIGAGERTGRLGLVLERVANFVETELNTAIKTLTSMLEPAIVIFLGTVVGGLVLALLLPIFTISKAMH